MEKVIIEKLRMFFKNQPVEKAWVFGSFSRGEERDSSDVDIMVRFIPDARISLITYSGIMCALQDLLCRPVDLVEEGYLKSFAKESAERDKVLVYERAN